MSESQNNREKVNKIRLDDVISIVDLAARLGLSDKTIRNRVSAGLMPLPYKIPHTNQLFFLVHDLDEWLNDTLQQRPELGDDPRSPSPAGKRRGCKTKARQVAERRAGGGA